jgi:ribosomal protein L10
LLPGVEVLGLDEDLGRKVGVLLARTKTSDVIDAALALLAMDGDQLLTADVHDLRRLLRATGVQVDIVKV